MMKRHHVGSAPYRWFQPLLAELTSVHGAIVDIIETGLNTAQWILNGSPQKQGDCKDDRYVNMSYDAVGNVLNCGMPSHQVGEALQAKILLDIAAYLDITDHVPYRNYAIGYAIAIYTSEPQIFLSISDDSADVHIYHFWREENTCNCRLLEYVSICDPDYQHMIKETIEHFSANYSQSESSVIH